MPIVVSISNGSHQPPSIDIAYDLTKHIVWEKYTEAIIDGEQLVEILSPREEYRFLSELIISSALQAQRRPVSGPSVRRKPPNQWWDSECAEIYREKSAAFKEFRKRGSVENFNRYASLESKFKNLVKAKKSGYWRRFVEGLSREISMRTLWNVGRTMRKTRESRVRP